MQPAQHVHIGTHGLLPLPCAPSLCSTTRVRHALTTQVRMTNLFALCAGRVENAAMSIRHHVSIPRLNSGGSYIYHHPVTLQDLYTGSVQCVPCCACPARSSSAHSNYATVIAPVDDIGSPASLQLCISLPPQPSIVCKPAAFGRITC